METILVVDDEPASLVLLTKILAADGYRVRSADSGKLALASVSMEMPDLILADVRMPGMDGFEFCRQLKAVKASASRPLIFMSAATDSNALVEGLALGAVDFVFKPFQPQELLARVRTHLDLSLKLQREVADRGHAQEALKESEELFRNVANTARILIWVAGPDKLCTFFNSNWLAFRGRTLEQELGNGWAAGVHPDDLDRCLATYSRSFDTRRSFKMEYRLLRADGEYRWVLDEGVPRLHPAGDFLGYIGCCLDITDVKRAQQEALGRERVESLRVLAGGIAHDFTNLMATILSTAELAEAEIADGSSAGEEIETIKTVAKRAIEMARELMTYAGEDKGNVELIDLSLLVEDMADILKSSISKRSALKIDLTKKPPLIWGNPTHMRQIVMNLIINASEAIGERGGTIKIRVSPATGEQRSELRNVNALAEGDYLRLEVSDNGCGITDEQRTRIFDPFFTTKGKGNGLGLAVVHGVVHSYGGAINVASAPGRGTTFEIFLPCVAQGSLKIASSAYQASSSVH